MIINLRGKEKRSIRREGRIFCLITTGGRKREGGRESLMAQRKRLLIS
jgi:hypothetical protein